MWAEFSGDHPIDLASRVDVVRFIEGKLAKMAAYTQARHLRQLGALYDHAMRASDDSYRNPFKGHVQASSAATASYIPFTEEELKKLFEVCDDEELARAIRIALYSGLRLSEIVAARRVVVQEVECWVIDEGKTRAAARKVPVHKALAGIQQPATAAQTLSKRFAALVDAAGIKDERKVFHSLRKCFSTRLENARVPEQIAARVLGHKMAGLSYGLYSGGLEVRELAKAVAKVSYPSLPKGGASPAPR